MGRIRRQCPARRRRWDLATNKLAEQLHLNAPRSEAYTPTLIGPDGTVYAMNDATLYAIGR